MQPRELEVVRHVLAGDSVVDWRGMEFSTHAEVDDLLRLNKLDWHNPRDARFGAAFWPKPVIVRLSDFKSNEYRKLLGGDRYEPEEENPMIGFRGASRFIAPSFAECFELECRALKHVRVMVPCERQLMLKQWGSKIAGRKPTEVLDELISVGVIAALPDDRLNVPDLCRVGFGLRRRGGLTP